MGIETVPRHTNTGAELRDQIRMSSNLPERGQSWQNIKWHENRHCRHHANRASQWEIHKSKITSCYVPESQETRAINGVALCNKLEKWLTDNEYVNERIVTAKIKLMRGTSDMVEAYAPQRLVCNLLLNFLKSFLQIPYRKSQE